nr:immunoglobulin heavy chain junction region [Mus musculus]
CARAYGSSYGFSFAYW